MSKLSKPSRESTLSITKIKSISFLVVAVLLLSITVINENISTAQAQKNNDIHYTANESSSQETPVLSPKEAEIYTVKEHNGVIAVFKQEEQIPVLRKEVQVSALPTQDKELLSKGVSFTSYKDMLFFLENYE